MPSTPSDLEIARTARIRPIEEIAAAAGINADALEQYGRYKAKIDPAQLQAPAPAGKVVLVSAMSPTPAGEGKSTTTVGLADSLARAGHKVMIALREPSLGPVLGMKGGATGGGPSSRGGRSGSPSCKRTNNHRRLAAIHGGGALQIAHA